MTQISFIQLVDLVRSVQTAYYRLVVIAGVLGCGKTRLLNQVATHLSMPKINLSLLVSRSLLPMSHRQRMLKAPAVAMDTIDAHGSAGVCLDDTELLFDSSLRLNPLTFLQDVSRNRLIVATWNGALEGGELRYASAGHPDFFRQPVGGYPVVTLTEDKFQLHFST